MKFTFYRATLMRGTSCRPVSVRPSVIFTYCIQTAKGIIRLSSRSGSPIILVFFTPSVVTRETPLGGALNKCVFRKIRNFRQYLALSWNGTR